MTKIHGVNVMKLKKPSNVLRLSAKILEKGMYIGCCRTFATIEDKICEELQWEANALDNSEALKVVDRARLLFSSLYAPYFGNIMHPRTDGGHAESYWFGHTNIECNQQHRITALLLTADMAESVGE